MFWLECQRISDTFSYSRIHARENTRELRAIAQAHIHQAKALIGCGPSWLNPENFRGELPLNLPPDPSGISPSGPTRSHGAATDRMSIRRDGVERGLITKLKEWYSFFFPGGI